MLVIGIGALEREAIKWGITIRQWLLWIGAILSVAWCGFYGLMWAVSGIMSPAATATVLVFAAGAPTLVLFAGMVSVAAFHRRWQGLVLPSALAVVGGLCALGLLTNG